MNFRIVLANGKLDITECQAMNVDYNESLPSSQDLVILP